MMSPGLVAFPLGAPAGLRHSRVGLREGVRRCVSIKRSAGRFDQFFAVNGGVEASINAFPETDHGSPPDENLRKFDQSRKDKKVFNDTWFDPNDPDAKIARTKDDRRRLACKTGHKVRMDSELNPAAPVPGACR